MRSATVFLLAAVVANGLVVGATLDQSIKQLPARHRLGALAYSAYAQAADFKGGLVWYPILAVAAVVATIGAAVVGLVDDPSERESVALILAAAGTAGHMLVTARAAPTFLSLRRFGADEHALSRVLDRFARLQTARAAVQVATLASVVWAMAANLAGG